ncbi:Unknown protein sequence [Pseudomonas amygdali pv. sesami]|nr:Unknown protein sequence [Pseudomonas amygdali pv. sesami]
MAGSRVAGLLGMQEHLKTRAVAVRVCLADNARSLARYHEPYKR